MAQTVKNLHINARDTGDAGSLPELGRSPGGGHGNLLQYCWLQNPTGRGACWATVHGGHRESDTTEQMKLSLLISIQQVLKDKLFVSHFLSHWFFVFFCINFVYDSISFPLQIR